MATRRRKTNIEEEVAESIDSQEKETTTINKKKIKQRNLLSSGSTVLDMACTDTTHGTFLKGRYYLLVGASGAGKTWLSLTAFGESGLHAKFKNYKLIYDNAEDGANMDMEFYFGKKTAERIQPPEPGRIVVEKDEKGDTYECEQDCSKTAEQFYDSLSSHLDKAEKNGHGIIYVLDSMDSLTTEAELKKFNEDKKLRKSGKDGSGSYGDGKAKINSSKLRAICQRLDRSGSILIIVCQERDNIGSPVGGKTFSGGHALTFYATLQIWFKKFKEIKATIKGKERLLGQLTKVQIKKNRLTGQNSKEVIVPIYHTFGIDNIGSLIDWLIDEGHWKGGKTTASKIDATEFGVAFKKEKLVKHIEENELEQQLIDIAGEVWEGVKLEIQQKVQRKKRYE